MSLQVEVQEALCSALYSMSFAEFMGENETPEGFCAYFHIGERPKDLRVTIIRPRNVEGISIRVEWRNYKADARNPLKGEKMMKVDTLYKTKSVLMLASEKAITGILAIYNDVLTEEGVAGMIADLVESPETESD